MKLKIIRTSKGSFYSGHVYLYAWSESEDDFFIKKGKKQYAIEVDFPDAKTIKVVPEPDSYYENHNSVILDSTVKLKDFYNAMRKSVFSDAGFYHTAGRNCVHSVIFALKTAKIDINLDREYNFKHIASCFFCPTTLTTPRELIATLKDEKIKKQPNHSINSDETSLIYKTDETSDQIRELEKSAVTIERMSTTCYSTSHLSLFSGTAATITSGTLINWSAALTLGIPITLLSLGASCLLGYVFEDDADILGEEIEEEYEKISASVMTAPGN